MSRPPRSSPTGGPFTPPPPTTASPTTPPNARTFATAATRSSAVTRDDVDNVKPESPGLRTEFASFILTKAGDELSKSAVDLVFANAVDLLLAWIQQPSRPGRSQLANWLPILALASLQQLGRHATGDSPASLALAALDGKMMESPSADTLVWRHGEFAAAIRISPDSQSSTEVAIVLDDSDAALSQDSKAAWQEWLRWSNLLNFRALPTQITTRQLLATAPAAVPIAEPATGVPPRRAASPTTGRTSLSEVDPTCGRSSSELAQAQLPLPDVGEEVSGIPVEISWPRHRVAVDIGVNSDERQELTDGGWTVCPADTDSLRAALQNGAA